MERKMRRIKQLLSEEDTKKILERGTNGVLALFGDDGYPYGVPISYSYLDNKIYFHSSKEGYKIDAIRKNDKVSFTVIDKDEIVPKELTTYFRSAIVFGRVKIIEDDNQKREALIKFASKYSKDYPQKIKESIKAEWDTVLMLEIEIEHMTGKEAIELVRAREA